MIWIILGIIITFWGIKIIWAYVQASSNSAANSGSSFVNVINIDNLDVTLEWGNCPVTNGNFIISKKTTWGLFSHWQVAKVISGNGYTSGTEKISLERGGLWQFKVEGDGGYPFGITQRYL